MAAQVFTWRPRIESPVQVRFKTYMTQFVDGYAQATGDGINNKSQTWNLTFIGKQSEIFAIQAFLDEHAGWKSFSWSPSFGAMGFYRAGGYESSKIGANVYNLTVTFTQTFQP